MASVTKKPKVSSSIEWRQFSTPPTSFAIGDYVFARPKSRAERPNRGTVVSILEKKVSIRVENNDNSSYKKLVRTQRLLPIFQSPSCNEQLVIVTPETLPYRLLAASQVNGADHILEIGCSTGEASAVLARYAKKFLGFDTSKEMIAKCKAKLPQDAQHAYKVDVFADPRRANQLVMDVLGDEPSVVFIDIGGNRELSGVHRMISWAQEAYAPRLLVVKSRELVSSFQDDGKPIVNGVLVNGQRRFRNKLSVAGNNKLPSHPLKAPLVLSPSDRTTPICRYHNYHAKGCLKKGYSCKLDHEHCHSCLTKGHIARHCPGFQGS